MYGPNLAAFGLPSSIVALAGPVSGTLVYAPDFSTFTWTSFTGHFRVLTDVCAALS